MGKFKYMVLLLAAVLILGGLPAYAGESGPVVGTASSLTAPVYSYTEGKQYEDFAQGYIDLLGYVQTDIMRIRTLFEQTDVNLYDVILTDISGDFIPELIFATIEDEQGSVVLTMNSSLEYTHKITVHIVSFDPASGSVIFLKDFDALCYDDQGNYSHFGIWPGAFYVVQDNNNLYYRQTVSWSGLAGIIEEYTFDETGRALVKTYEVLTGPADAGEEDITSAGAASVFRMDENVLLLIDAYGNSYFQKMLPDAAIEYLRTGGAQEEPSVNDQENIRIVDADLVIPEDLDPYKKAYLALLVGFMGYADDEAAKARNVVIDNVYGDETPELICVMQDPLGSGRKDLYIFTYSDEKIMQVYRSAWDQLQYADKYYYYLFRRKDDDTLYIYRNIGSGSWLDETYSSLRPDRSEGMKEEVIFEMIVDSSDEENEGYYARLGVPIPSWDYDIGVKPYIEELDQVVLIDYDGWDYDDNYVGEHESKAKTLSEVIEHLISGR